MVYFHTRLRSHTSGFEPGGLDQRKLLTLGAEMRDGHSPNGGPAPDIPRAILSSAPSLARLV